MPTSAEPLLRPPYEEDQQVAALISESSRPGSSSWQFRAMERNAVFGGFFLAVSCGLLTVVPSRLTVVELFAWAIGCLATSVWWAGEVASYWQSKWDLSDRTRTDDCRILCSCIALGLLWSAPAAMWSSAFSDLQLQTYSWLTLSVCVFVCASIPMQTLHLNVLLGGVLIPLAWAWSKSPVPAEGNIFNVLLAGGWAVCTYLQQRALSFTHKALKMARERATIVDALAQRNRMLEAAHRSKSRVLTTASHEIRQPVHALGLLVERLRLDQEAHHLRAQVDDIGSIVQSLSHSLGLLLDISKLDEGVVAVTSSRFPVRKLIDKILAEHEVGANDKGLRLAVAAGPEAWVQTDASLLYSILSNLVSNAIRYTELGEISILCEVRGAQVFIDVTDTGMGIPEAYQESIFREYVRLDRENQSTQGFGLGLAIVRRTADLLGASISLDSTPGKGSRFTVSLPLSTAPADTGDHPVDPPMAASLAVGRSLVGHRVLVVDNDPVVLRGMEAMLRSWGCTPIVASGFEDLQSTLRHLSAGDYDFVVADFHLGAGKRNGMDAIELVREACGQSLPAALLTGDLSIRSSDGGAENAVYVLHKPVLPARLRELLEMLSAGVQHRPG